MVPSTSRSKLRCNSLGASSRAQGLGACDPEPRLRVAGHRVDPNEVFRSRAVPVRFRRTGLPPISATTDAGNWGRWLRRRRPGERLSPPELQRSRRPGLVGGSGRISRRLNGRSQRTYRHLGLAGRHINRSSVGGDAHPRHPRRSHHRTQPPADSSRWVSVPVGRLGQTGYRRVGARRINRSPLVPGE